MEKSEIRPKYTYKMGNDIILWEKEEKHMREVIQDI